MAFQRHNRRDIWTSEADAIGSTANYLAKHGWIKGLPWGSRPSTRQFRADGDGTPRHLPRFCPSQLAACEKLTVPVAESGEARLLILAGLNGPVFLVTKQLRRDWDLQQFDGLCAFRWLAGRRRVGCSGLIAQWPTRDHPLTAAQIQKLQKLKKMAGGTSTERSAIRPSASAPIRSGMAHAGWLRRPRLFRRINALP